MTFPQVVVVVALAFLCDVSAFHKNRSDIGLSVVELIRNNGYPAEAHKITTEDGFILEYHRIPHGFNDTELKSRPPIINFHGMHFSSGQDLAQGPGKAFNYMLADAGFDVWAANARGNHYSNQHLTLDKTKDLEKFYDFSYHEMGYYDVPAAVDYILNVTGHDSVFYTGNSLGATVFLAFAASRPEYNKKIKLAALFSAAAYVSPRKHPNVESGVSHGLFAMTKYLDSLYNLAKQNKIVMLEYKYIRAIGPYFCMQPAFIDACLEVASYVFGNKDDAEAFRPYIGVLLSNAPSEISIKTYVHVGQQIKSGKFRWFDYGPKKNLKVYGALEPPTYDLSKVTAPVALYYAKKDLLLTEEDQKKTKSSLPNVVYDFVETSGRYGHLSFGAAKDVSDVVWSDVIRLMNKYK